MALSVLHTLSHVCEMSKLFLVVLYTQRERREAGREKGEREEAECHCLRGKMGMMQEGRREIINTVEPLIMDTLKSGQPPYNGQTVSPLSIYMSILRRRDNL